ncbi:MAG: sugar phosphate isomerase/epimerase [Clostridia bacterium]|nr:sugar phosphate isomerase/epimerase [Clostridia bacterium]
MIKGVLCSTGAMITKFNGRDPRLLREFFPRLEADGVEFMVYPSWDAVLDENIEAVRRISLDVGMRIPVLHMDKRIGELLSLGSDDEIREAGERFKNNLLIARRLGAELAVLHLWGGPASDHDIERNVSVLGDYLIEAERAGIILTVENVVCAVETPLAHLRRIMDTYPNALFTIDTKMAEFHRELPATLAEDRLWDGRTPHLHVNDYGGGVKDFTDLRVLHMGDGHVDFKPFFEKIKAIDYSGWLTVESSSVFPDGRVDFIKLNRTIQKVRKAAE